MTVAFVMGKAPIRLAVLFIHVLPVSTNIFKAGLWLKRRMNPVILEDDLIINNDLDWFKIGSSKVVYQLD